MKRHAILIASGLGLAAAALLCHVPVQGQPTPDDRGAIRRIDPPEQGFYTRELDYEGIPIKAPDVVADQALFIARERLQSLLKHLPNALFNLTLAGAELHIIGRDQVTSDLPEYRDLKGKPFDGSLTVDQRTRGLGGLLTSCGEENLLKLPGDRYAGRDICIHEFAHNIQDTGLSEEVRRRIREQYHRSLDQGLWKGAYAATNESEYFAELTMWYFGTHGDMNMTGKKPADGPEGLKRYDPQAYSLLDALYSGRIPVTRVKVVRLKTCSPAREKDLRSGAQQETTRILFVNRTSHEVQLYQVDPDGRREARGTVGPKERLSKGAFASQVWVATDLNDRPIALYVADPEPGLAVIQGTATDL